MIHTVTDFYNKVMIDLRNAYFPGKTPIELLDNENHRQVRNTVELFSNGCLNYRKLIGRLAKHCGHTTEKINAIVERHITSFGNYKYTPTKK